MPQPKKQFCEYRNQSKDPFVQLFYEVLNRFHKDDYDIAIAEMSPTLRDIIVACNERLQSQGESSALSYLINEVVCHYDSKVFYIFDDEGNMQDVTDVVEKAMQMQAERTNKK